MESVEVYESILGDLDPYFDLDSVTTKITALKKTNNYRKRSKEIAKIASLEKSWTEKLVGRIKQEIAQEEVPPYFNWWHKSMNRLEEDFVQHKLKAYQYMGVRLKNMIFALAIESLDASVAQMNEKEVSYYVRLLEAVRPDNPYVYMRAATSYARLNKAEEAIQYLRTAVIKGWKNREWILNNPAFKSLESQEAFQAILEDLPQ